MLKNFCCDFKIDCAELFFKFKKFLKHYLCRVVEKQRAAAVGKSPNQRQPLLTHLPLNMKIEKMLSNCIQKNLILFIKTYIFSP